MAKHLLTVSLFEAEFNNLMGMSSGEALPNSKLTGTEVHLVGPGAKGEEVGSFTFNTDRAGNVTPGSAHAHPEYTKKT